MRHDQYAVSESIDLDLKARFPEIDTLHQSGNAINAINAINQEFLGDQSLLVNCCTRIFPRSRRNLGICVARLSATVKLNEHIFETLFAYGLLCQMYAGLILEI